MSKKDIQRGDKLSRMFDSYAAGTDYVPQSPDAVTESIRRWREEQQVKSRQLLEETLGGNHGDSLVVDGVVHGEETRPTIRFGHEYDIPITIPKIDDIVWGKPILGSVDEVIGVQADDKTFEYAPRTKVKTKSGQIKFGSHLVDERGVVQELKNQVEKVLIVSLQSLRGRSENEIVEMEAANEIYQVWGPQVGNRQACTLACMEMCWNHMGWIKNGGKSGFDFIKGKLDMVSRAQRINPELIAGESGGFLLSPRRELLNDYRRFFRDTFDTLKGGWAEANAKVDALSVEGGYEWAKQYLVEQGLSDEVEGFYRDTQHNVDNPYLTGLAMVHRIVSSFVHKEGEVFSVSQTAIQSASDNTHQVMITGIEWDESSKYGLKFRVVDPLHTDYRYVLKSPEEFIGSGIFFAAKKPDIDSNPKIRW